MEKLREHERDMTCPKGSSRAMIPTTKSMQLIAKSAKPTSNRFNKAAGNVLTKIRYLIYLLLRFISIMEVINYFLTINYIGKQSPRKIPIIILEVNDYDIYKYLCNKNNYCTLLWYRFVHQVINLM